MSIIDLKVKTYDELTFEITRLNTDKYLLEQKLQQKENIIKEVREYINKCHILDKEIQIDYCLDEDIKNDILEILDKVD